MQCRNLRVLSIFYSINNNKNSKCVGVLKKQHSTKMYKIFVTTVKYLTFFQVFYYHYEAKHMFKYDYVKLNKRINVLLKFSLKVA